MCRVGPHRWALLRDVRLTALRGAPHAFASTYERERDDPEPLWRERAERFAWFVAAGPALQEPVGLTAGAPPFDGRPDRRDLISMWVHPQRRGEGIAARLVEAVCGWAVAEGARRLGLWVADGNDAAARVYARAGFVPSGRRQPLPSNPTVGEAQWLLTIGPDVRRTP